MLEIKFWVILKKKGRGGHFSRGGPFKFPTFLDWKSYWQTEEVHRRAFSGTQTRGRGLRMYLLQARPGRYLVLPRGRCRHWGRGEQGKQPRGASPGRHGGRRGDSDERPAFAIQRRQGTCGKVS